VELLTSTAGVICILHRRAFDRTVRTKDAAIAGLGTEQRFAVRAFVKKLASIGGHRFLLREAANRAYEHRFEKNFTHG
jgi:hypothetical protein